MGWCLIPVKPIPMGWLKLSAQLVQQGQLHVTRKSWCDLVVWTPSEISVERIQYDDELWRNKMYPKQDRQD